MIGSTGLIAGTSYEQHKQGMIILLGWRFSPISTIDACALGPVPISVALGTLACRNFRAVRMRSPDPQGNRTRKQFQ